MTLCLNLYLFTSPHETDSGSGVSTTFHCHFDSSYCLSNEEWLNPFQVENEGLGPCTCDDDYNSNVLIHTCIDTEVTCTANKDQVSKSIWVIDLVLFYL